MVRDYVKQQRGSCTTLRLTSGVRARAFLGLPFFYFFVLAGLEQHQKGGEVVSSFGIGALGVLMKQYSLRIGEFGGEGYDVHPHLPAPTCGGPCPG